MKRSFTITGPLTLEEFYTHVAYFEEHWAKQVVGVHLNPKRMKDLYAWDITQLGKKTDKPIDTTATIGEFSVELNGDIDYDTMVLQA